MLKAGEGPLYTLYATSPLKMVGQKIPPVICSLEKEQFAPKPWWLEDYFLFEMVPFQGTCFFWEGLRNLANGKLIWRVVFLPNASMISTIIVVLTIFPRWLSVHNVRNAGPWLLG